MTGIATVRRARTARWVWLAAIVGALAVLPAVGAAQVRPDTVPRDTVQVPIPPEGVAADTLPADSLLRSMPDSLRDAAVFPSFPSPYPTGWGAARWQWSREELLRYRGLTVLELLERVPGLTSVRAGSFGRPAGLTALGAGGARVRVFWDGLEMDPLATGTLDLQHVGLVDLESVRVERGPGEIRVELASLRLQDARPYSEVEVGAGIYNAKLLRGLLSRPIGSRNVVTAAYDLATTNGIALYEPFQFSGGRVTWSHTPSENSALRLDLLRSSVTREGDRAPVDLNRQDLVLRGRLEPLSGLVLDGLLARSVLAPGDTAEQRSSGIPGAPEADTLVRDHRGTQAMLRAGYRLPFAHVEAAARARGGGDHRVPAPQLDLSARALFQPAGWLSGEAEVHAATLNGQQAISLGGTGRLGPIGGLSAFGTVTLGERWVAGVRDTLDVIVALPEAGMLSLRTNLVRPRFSAARAAVGGVRAGVEWSGAGASLGAAVLAQQAARIAPFGLAFDRAVSAVQGGAAAGVEAYADLPVPFTGGVARLEGWYQHWTDTGQRPYLPSEQGRVALEFHKVLVQGQFEPTLRVEAVHRGPAVVPRFAGDAFDNVSPPYSLLNLYLQIRILDVRAFLFWDNVLSNRQALDVPEAQYLAPRLLYGVRWFFRN